MPAVGITDGLPPAHDHWVVVLTCSHLASRWAALECRSTWLFVNTSKGVLQRNPQS